METIAQKVKALVASQLGLDKDEIKNEHKIREDLGADSLDQVELVMAIEDEFHLDVKDEDEEKLTTVQGVIDYVTNAKEDKQDAATIQQRLGEQAIPVKLENL